MKSNTKHFECSYRSSAARAQPEAKGGAQQQQWEVGTSTIPPSVLHGTRHSDRHRTGILSEDSSSCSISSRSHAPIYSWCRSYSFLQRYRSSKRPLADTAGTRTGFSPSRSNISLLSPIHFDVWRRWRNVVKCSSLWSCRPLFGVWTWKQSCNKQCSDEGT